MEYDIIFSQVGTPKSDAPQDIKAFLKVFLGSRRVVDMTPLIWWPILHFIILKKRPKVVSSRYRAMNESYGSNPT
ncbi:MAG: ferrochelatase, partial [Bacteriovoracaceae bacterium]|nr:ferrochelatase [Bacteriovoracaceae bacterium]